MRHEMNRDELLTELASRISNVSRTHPVRVGIDGVDASGKTTLANELLPLLEASGRNVVRASIDRFHNPAAIRKHRGAESPIGYFHDSFNYDALVESLLQPLGPSGKRQFRRAIFDFRSDAPIDAPLEDAPPDAVLLFDGVFLLRPELRGYWDFSLFVRASFEITVKRAEERDLYLFGTAADVRLRYERRYVPGQRLYLSEAQPERWASVVIDNDDPANPSIVGAA
jgi:uridine kinase